MNLEDMKKILEDFPQYRASKIMTVKHVECLNTMSTMISERDLMTQGSLEYAIACSQAAMQSHLQQVQDIVMGKRASGKGWIGWHRCAAWGGERGCHIHRHVVRRPGQAAPADAAGAEVRAGGHEPRVAAGEQPGSVRCHPGGPHGEPRHRHA